DNPIQGTSPHGGHFPLANQGEMPAGPAPESTDKAHSANQANGVPPAVRVAFATPIHLAWLINFCHKSAGWPSWLVHWFSYHSRFGCARDALGVSHHRERRRPALLPSREQGAAWLAEHFVFPSHPPPAS